LIVSLSQSVEITSSIVSVVRDVKDNMILATAVAGNADYIVTGDKDLLVLRAYEHISILDVNTFLEIFNNLGTR
jgi:uncharacterized protein